MSDPLAPDLTGLHPAAQMDNVASTPTPDLGPAPREKSHDWLKITLPVALIAAFAELGLAILNNSALPVFYKQGLGLDTFIYTVLMAPFFFSESVFKSPLGVLADRWGRKPLMVIGPAISIFTPLILISIHYPRHQTSVPLLFLFGFLRLLDGLGAAALWPAMFAYIGDHVRDEKRTSAMSVLEVTYMMGLAFGFLAGGWVDDTFGPVLSGEASLRSAVAGVYHTMRHNIHERLHHGIHHHLHLLVIHARALGLPVNIDQPAQYHPSFYLASVLFALATIVALLSLRSRSIDKQLGIEEIHQEPGPPMTWAAFVVAVKSVPNLMIIAFTTFLGIGCIALLVKVFALDELGVTETEFGVLILWPAILIGAMAIPLGHLSDKIGKILSVRGGFLLAAVGMWAVVVMFQIPMVRDLGLIIGGSLLGLGFVVAFPAWMALLTTYGGESQRGTIVGAVSTAQGVGSMFGILIGGALYSHSFHDPHLAHLAPFGASAILLTISALMTFFMISSSGKITASA